MTNHQSTSSRPNEPPMPEPLAYFLTWTTYGTWLPGDERGWVLRGKGFQLPAPIRQESAKKRMTESVCTLNQEERAVVEKTITDHCRIRGWYLHAANSRSNHVHVVVTAHGRSPEDVRDQFKAWCTRKLNEHMRNTSPTRQRGNTIDTPPIRENWWTEKGSQRYIGDEESLEAVIIYVLDAQDRKDRDVIGISPQRQQGSTACDLQPLTEPNVKTSVPSLARRAGIGERREGGVE